MCVCVCVCVCVCMCAYAVYINIRILSTGIHSSIMVEFWVQRSAYEISISLDVGVNVRR